MRLFPVYVVETNSFAEGIKPITLYFEQLPNRMLCVGGLETWKKMMDENADECEREWRTSPQQGKYNKAWTASYNACREIVLCSREDAWMSIHTRLKSDDRAYWSQTLGVDVGGVRVGVMKIKRVNMMRN